MTAKQREALIRKGVADFYGKTLPAIKIAYSQEDWKVLGYKSWAEYLQSLMGDLLPRLSKAERNMIAKHLTEMGMSTRAVGAVAGVSQATVSRISRGLLNEKGSTQSRNPTRNFNGARVSTPRGNVIRAIAEVDVALKKVTDGTQKAQLDLSRMALLNALNSFEKAMK